MQLFLSVLFIIYLKLKYKRPSSPIYWLIVFFFIKLGTDLYGILNYTSWIKEILTQAVLSIYRLAMGSFEIGMIGSLLLFHLTAKGKEFKFSKQLFFFIPAIIFFPINLLLYEWDQSTLIGAFNAVKVLWIGITLYLLFYQKGKELIVLLSFILAWNGIWLAEVVLHQQAGIISEATSWILFVTAEMLMTIGLSYFLMQIIADPRLLKFDAPEDILPKSLFNTIQVKLNHAVEIDQIYKDPELSAVSLSERLGVSSVDLTTYMNRFLRKNFNQYIMEFRINESKRLLQDASAQEMTIEQIMIESGFNSKSVFNTAFKKATGLTPSQFRKKNIQKTD